MISKQKNLNNSVTGFNSARRKHTQDADGISELDLNSVKHKLGDTSSQMARSFKRGPGPAKEGLFPEITKP